MRKWPGALPAKNPETKVAIRGVFLPLWTRERHLKSSPSSAMAWITRGIGNMEPSKLSWRDMRQAAHIYHPEGIGTSSVPGAGQQLNRANPQPSRSPAVPSSARNRTSPTWWRGHRVSQRQRRSGRAPNQLPGKPQAEGCSCSGGSRAP